MGARSTLRRIARWALRISAGAAVFLAITLLVVLSGPGRQQILDRTLRQLDSMLPGRLEVGDASWSLPLRLELRDLRWTESSDTLLTAARLDAGLDLSSLAGGDVVVSTLHLEKGRADVERLQAVFVDTTASDEAPPSGDAGGGLPWPLREGALPGLPSLQLQSVRIELRASGVPGIDEGAGRVLADLDAALDLRQGTTPALRVKRLQVEVPGRELALRSQGLELDLARRAWSGTLSGQYTEAWPFRLEAQTHEGEWSLVLAEPEGAGPPESMGLRLRWRPHGEDPLGSGDLDLVLRTPSGDRLRRDPRLSARVDSLPVALPPLVLRADGEASLTGEPIAAVDLVLEPSALLEEARLHTDWRDGALRIEDLRIRGDGLEISGRGEGDAEGQEFEIQGRLTSLGWLQGMVEPTAVEALDLRLSLRGRGSREAPDLSASVAGSLRTGGRSLQDLRLEAEARLDDRPTVRFDLQGASSPLRVAWGGSVSLGDSVVAELEPMRVVSSSEELHLAPKKERSRPARVVAIPATGRVEVRDLSIDAGGPSLRASGWFETEQGASLEASLRGGSAPPWLADLVGPDTAARLDSVRWDPLALDLDADWRVGPGDERATARLELSLPGPEQLGPLLPADLITDGLDALRLDLTVEASRPSTRAWSFSSRLDPTPTSWIEGRPLRVAYREGAIEVDSLRLSLLGLELEGALASAGDSLRGRWRLGEIDDTTVRARWRSLPPDLEFALRAAGEIEGVRERPRLRTQLDARIRQGDIDVPRVELVAQTTGADLDRARLHLVEGARGLPVVLRRVELGVESAPDSLRTAGPVDHWISLHAEGPVLRWDQVARVQLDSMVRVRSDTLALRWRDRDLRARDPFRLTWNPDRRRLDLEGLDLEGSLGRLVGTGYVEPDTSSIDARAELRVPPPPPDALRSIPRPTELRAGLRSAEGGGLDLTVDATGLVLGEPTPQDLRVRGHLGRRTRVELALGPPEGPSRLEGEVELRPPSGASGRPSIADRLEGELRVDGLAIPRRAGEMAQVLDEWLRGEGENPPRLDARVELAGAVDRPVVDAEGGLRFPRGWRLSDDELRFRADYDSSGTVRADLDWSRRDRSLLEMTFTLDDPDRDPATAARLRASVESEDFDLADLDPILPPRMAVRGRLRMDLQAEGDVAQPVVEGELEARELFVRLVDGSQVRGRADLRFGPASGGGTLARGTVRIDQGVIQIPERGRTLAPKEGTALLWQLEESSPRPVGRDDLELAPPDSARATVTRSAKEKGGGGPPPFQADINVSIPTGMWIRGSGIEIEMGGELDVELAGSEPVLVGTLQARAGALSLLGQRFELQRGEVVFYGGDAIDPTLDIVLGLEKDDVEVRVLLTGTARDPKLALESDPPMPESDIFSHLLFGEEDEDLSGGQNELLRSETARALQAFAIPTIERQLSDTLGLDMVRIGRGTQDSSSQALMAGKYLSPRVLLSYEQSLEEGDAFFVNLRYWITRDLTLESRLGRSDPSSVQLNWSVDY